MIRHKRVILVDDCIAGGASMAKSRIALAPYVSALTCHVLLDLRGADDPALMEDIVNSIAIRPDGGHALTRMWNIDTHFTTSKLLAHSLRIGIGALTRGLTILGAVNLYLSALLFLNLEPSGTEDGGLELCELAATLRNEHGLSVVTPQAVSDAISGGESVQESRREILLDWLKKRLGSYNGYRVPDDDGMQCVLRDFAEMVECLHDVPIAYQLPRL
jgi:hypothetical protein